MILIYLDAHWEEEWPILDELSIISKTHYNNCVIIIDDIKVPFKNDIPYDTYNNVELTYEYIKNKLSNIYSNYKYTYIVPKDVRSRAKLVVMPAHM
jgi:hypothetical protein